MKFDLAKSRLNLLKKANNHVKEIPAINFCYADVNCCLLVKFHAAEQEDIFFSTFDKLRDIRDSEIKVFFYYGIKHLQPMFHFFIPLKHWKTIGFPMVSRAREVQNWLEISCVPKLMCIV